MTRVWYSLVLIPIFVAPPLAAQSLARRVTAAGDGAVQFTFASRPGVCGDGITYLRDGLGGESRVVENGSFTGRRGDADWADCVPAPVRVVARVADGQVVRLRTYVGPRHAASDPDRRDLGLVSVGDAVDFLTHLAEEARGRPASDAILPIVLADSTRPWAVLLRFARDERLSHDVRSTTNFWLARGSAARLGVTDHDDDEEDEVRNSAVFALSQQPRESAVPRLIEIVQHSSRPAVRAQALFWLGQSGDARATDLFDEILRRR
jgi:hypothetical protein